MKKVIILSLLLSFKATFSMDQQPFLEIKIAKSLETFKNNYLFICKDHTKLAQWMRTQNLPNSVSNNADQMYTNHKIFTIKKEEQKLSLILKKQINVEDYLDSILVAQSNEELREIALVFIEKTTEKN